jgi:hypothetical protein
MSEDLVIRVAMSERERFTLAVFFSNTLKPKDKAARRAMKLAFKRLTLDEIVDRMRKPSGINVQLLKDVQVPVPINQETVDYVITNLNNVESTSADSLILSDIEDKFELVKSGKYELPEAESAKVLDIGAK